ncbi:MAG: heparinase II/III family protein [Candidatus Kapaibacterium sp.]
MSKFQELRLAVKRLGIGGTIRLLTEKRAKKRRLQALLRSETGFAELILPKHPLPEIPENDKITLIERADEMMNDENYFFTFIHHLKGIPDPWNYDPIEKKYWSKKRYDENRVHSGETPHDVKIIWEINRFKYLPLLAQAAAITGNKKYADECEARILSWIEGNPFAASINWSSPLEIAIRAISWSASLRMLIIAGFDISNDPKIAQSIWQHAAYLNAELSTDKIVRSNHLIGEAAGLYIISSFFDFPEAVFYRLRAKKILTDSILKQTYSDGASREASGWYHTFIADFADLVLRIASETEDAFDKEFTDRYEQISIYRNSIILPDGDPVRFGDCDFGKAINLSSKWKDVIFGENGITSQKKNCYFEKAQHLTARLGSHFVFVRAGEFGWGGDGFSSHAHDDFLSPIVALDTVNILVDPGTYAYNGAGEQRDLERRAYSHNGLIISGETGAILKSSFGWLKTRPNATIDSFSWAEEKITAESSYAEWKGQHSRHFTLTKEEFILEDHFRMNADQTLEWNFHFHPRWRLEKISPLKFALHDFRDNHYKFELSGTEAELEVLKYDFAPAYMQKSNAWKLRIHDSIHKGEHRTVKFILKKL